MPFGRISCALGRHRVELSNIRKVSGREVSRCRKCKQVVEQEAPGYWTVAPLHDAGLGHRVR